MNLVIDLHKDRSKLGVLACTDGAAFSQSFRCLGQSDLTGAQAHNNPTRDTLKPYGNIPTGIYSVTMVYALPVTEDSQRSYGPGPLFLLTAISGDGKTSNRTGLAIHGGPTGAPMPPNALRPTHGCIRVDDSTINFLMSKMLTPTKPFSQVIVREGA